MKTKDYEIFKLRKDNRCRIVNSHVERLVRSIQSQNLLCFTPILVSVDMEVIDGQHRLMAAKELGVDIYYKIEEGLKPEHVIAMNMVKPWSTADYLNYYCVNGYAEYIKLRDFMSRNNLNLKVALNLSIGRKEKEQLQFKTGQFVFNCEDLEEEIAHCWEIIHYIKKSKGFSEYTYSLKFWTALLMLVKHPNFDMRHCMKNLERLISRVGPRANTADYTKMLEDVYNWKSFNKLDLR